jgi:CRISPR-associated protein Cst2
MRSRESIKNAIMTQSGFYDDVKVSVNGAAQKAASEEYNATNCRAYESGYLTTGKNACNRKSSFFLTDAIAVNRFVPELRFHNNMYLANAAAKELGYNLQEQTQEAEDVILDENQVSKKGKKKEKKNPCGLMPYQYEYDKSLKSYSFTLFLDEVGIDENFKDKTVSNEEKANRVNTLLETIENLALIVKGNLDDASPLFVVGGLTNRRAHVFENIVNIKENKVIVSKELKNKMTEGFSCGVIESGIFDNEDEIVNELNAVSVSEFFSNLRKAVNDYYDVK